MPSSQCYFLVFLFRERKRGEKRRWALAAVLLLLLLPRARIEFCPNNGSLVGIPFECWRMVHEKLAAMPRTAEFYIRTNFYTPASTIRERIYTRDTRTAQKCMEIREQTICSQMMVFDRGFHQTIDTRDNWGLYSPDQRTSIMSCFLPLVYVEKFMSVHFLSALTLSGGSSSSQEWFAWALIVREKFRPCFEH